MLRRTRTDDILIQFMRRAYSEPKARKRQLLSLWHRPGRSNRVAVCTRATRTADLLLCQNGYSVRSSFPNSIDPIEQIIGDLYSLSGRFLAIVVFGDHRLSLSAALRGS
jgi:hypothetical protein